MSVGIAERERGERKGTNASVPSGVSDHEALGIHGSMTAAEEGIEKDKILHVLL